MRRNGPIGCLWLIEHKLTEKEFTTCGGARSKGRTANNRCGPASDVVEDHRLCYYHEAARCGYNYWRLTDRSPEVFPPDRLNSNEECPFKGGMNQLWRNMLLAMAVENDPDSPFEHVQFSVVHHADNHSLEPTMRAFRDLTAESPRFGWFSSQDIMDAVDTVGALELEDWSAWYRELYRV
jgi:hypothetical protein